MKKLLRTKASDAAILERTCSWKWEKATCLHHLTEFWKSCMPRVSIWRLHLIQMRQTWCLMYCPWNFHCWGYVVILYLVLIYPLCHFNIFLFLCFLFIVDIYLRASIMVFICYRIQRLLLAYHLDLSNIRYAFVWTAMLRSSLILLRCACFITRC